MKVTAYNEKGETTEIITTELIGFPSIDRNGFEYWEVNLYDWDNVQRSDCVWFNKETKKGYVPIKNKQTNELIKRDVDKIAFDKSTDIFQYVELTKTGIL